MWVKLKKMKGAFLLKPMLPTLTFHPPNQGDWYYEIKYDGFRGILNWSIEECILLSRNGKDLLPYSRS